MLADISCIPNLRSLNISLKNKTAQKNGGKPLGMCTSTQT